MAKNRAIEKLKKKVQRSPDNVKLRFKLIDLFSDTGFINEALDFISESLQCEFDKEVTRDFLEKADELLTGHAEIFGADHFNKLQEILKHKKLDAEWHYFTGKQILEDVRKQDQSVDTRDIARLSLEATRHLKDAVAVNLSEKYQFPCQLALARASLYAGNRKGALEKLLKLESGYTVIKGLEKYWTEFYQLLGQLSLEDSHDPKRAKSYIEKAIKLSRDSATRAHLRMELGAILLDLNQPEEALNSFERAFSDFRSSNQDAPFLLFIDSARCCQLMQRMDDAQEILKRCEKSRSLEPHQLYQLYKQKADYYREAAMITQTVEAQRIAYRNAESDSEKLDSGLQYLRDLFRRKKYKDIVDELPGLETLSKHPRDEKEFRTMGGLSYFYTSLWQDCIDYLTIAYTRGRINSEKDIPAAYALAKSLENMKKFDESIPIFRAIIEFSPDLKESAQAMKSLKQMKKILDGKPADGISTASTEVIEQLNGVIQEKTGEFTVMSRLRKGLSKTREAFTQKMVSILAGANSIDEDLLENLEELMILSDFGTTMTIDIVDSIRAETETGKIRRPEDVQGTIMEKLREFLTSYSRELKTVFPGPTIFLVVGVNGVGKTTTIAKLAHRYKNQGKHVMLVAGDTFRAGAIEQLNIWAERVGVEIVKHSAGSDPSAVIYDAIHAARARNVDMIIIDTAGRLQTKVNLMEEIKKNKRIISREIPDGPHEVLLVLDATTGQNALSQAKSFHEAVDVSGIVLTKLDGTAKGGIVVNVVKDLGVPVKLVGVGEQMEDLQDFDPEQFISSLFD